MTAKKITPQGIDYEAYLIERLGDLGEPQELWLPQVKSYAAQGFIETEFLLHIFTNIALANESAKRPFYPKIKRVVDICSCLLALPIFLLVFIAIGFAIKIDSKGPVFFMQKRVGKFAMPFSIFKFRTMYENSEAMLDKVTASTAANYFKVSNDPRITRVGKILRRWSLDETPQIFNILFGDMSLIGPRPLPIYDVAAIPYKHLDRFAVTPGLSGLWQVTARDSTDGLKNLKIDSQYVKNFGPKMDLWILWKTPWVVLKGIGAR